MFNSQTKMFNLKILIMKKSFYLIAALIMVLAIGCFTACKKNTRCACEKNTSCNCIELLKYYTINIPEPYELLKVLEDEPAYIGKGCYEFSQLSRRDAFGVILKAHHSYPYHFFPIVQLPEEYQKNGLEVLVSGNVFDYAEINRCALGPNVKLGPTYFFVLTDIKMDNK